MTGSLKEFMFFEPGMEKSFGYAVDSNTDRAMDHWINVTGDLAPYFALSATVLRNLAPGSTGSFTAAMKLPPELEAGYHYAYICSEESGTRGGGGGEGAMLGTKASVCAVITVFSAYPGKRADFDFSLQNVGKGENASFSLDAINLGTDAIDVYGEIEIRGLTVEAGKETTIAKVRTGQKHLDKTQRAVLNASLNTSSFEIGEYKAKATLFFDGNSTSKEKNFRIGSLDIRILNFTQEVTQGRLNPINVTAQSIWNAPIENVYASIEITNPKTYGKMTINSPPIDIGAWETKNITAYWDAKGVEPGDYSIKITLHYEDKTTEQEGMIKVKKQMLSLTALIMAAMAIVIIILIIMAIKLKKAQLKTNKPRERK
jgi:hypothetical protein